MIIATIIYDFVYSCIILLVVVVIHKPEIPQNEAMLLITATEEDKRYISHRRFHND
jgi:hypothetical protein